jgi:hypothetical protein
MSPVLSAGGRTDVRRERRRDPVARGAEAADLVEEDRHVDMGPPLPCSDGEARQASVA